MSQYQQTQGQVPYFQAVHPNAYHTHSAGNLGTTEYASGQYMDLKAVQSYGSAAGQGAVSKASAASGGEAASQYTVPAIPEFRRTRSANGVRVVNQAQAQQQPTQVPAAIQGQSQDQVQGQAPAQTQFRSQGYVQHQDQARTQIPAQAQAQFHDQYQGQYQGQAPAHAQVYQPADQGQIGEQLQQPVHYYPGTTQYHQTQHAGYQPAPFPAQVYVHKVGLDGVDHTVVCADADANSGEEESESLVIAETAWQGAERTRNRIYECKEKHRAFAEDFATKEILCLAHLQRAYGASTSSRLSRTCQTLKLTLYSLPRRHAKLSKESKQLKRDWRELALRYKVLRRMAISLCRDAQDEHEHNVEENRRNRDGVPWQKLLLKDLGDLYAVLYGRTAILSERTNVLRAGWRLLLTYLELSRLEDH